MKIPIEISCLGLLREYVIQREEGPKPLVVGHGLIPHQMKLGALYFSSSVWILNGEGEEILVYSNYPASPHTFT